MWNRFISSTYAHLVTAIALTLGVAAFLLTAQPQKSGMTGIAPSAQRASSPKAARSSLASQTDPQADDPASSAIIRVLRDDRTSGQLR